jgi:hypothetical protein
MSLSKILSNAAIMLSLKESPNCDPYSKFDLIDMTITPNPAKVGENVYMSIEFKNNYQIIEHGAIQKMKLTFNDFNIPIDDADLCDTHSGLCPIELGYDSINNTFIAPNSVGNYHVKVGWFEKDGLTSLLCFKGDFEIIPNGEQRTFRTNA